MCAIGDSHVEPGSRFLREIQRFLGHGYHVEAHGRRGWTSDRWIRSGDFGEECRDADIVLISLGGNDRTSGFSEEHTKENVETLVQQLPQRVLSVYHMGVPRFTLPESSLARDRVHLNPTGARNYAEVVSNFLRYP